MNHKPVPLKQIIHYMFLKKQQKCNVWGLT